MEPIQEEKQEITSITTISSRNIEKAFSDSLERLDVLDKMYSDIIITDNKSLETVRVGIKAYIMLRKEIDDAHKDAKSPILQLGKQLDAKKKEVLSSASPGESRLKSIKVDWDKEKQQEKEKKQRLERERIEAIDAKIDKINAFLELTGKSSDEFKKEIKRLEGMKIDPKKYQEFTEKAQRRRFYVLEILGKRLVEQTKHESDEADRAAKMKKIEEDNEKLKADNDALEKVVAEIPEAKVSTKGEALKITVNDEDVTHLVAKNSQDTPTPVTDAKEEDDLKSDIEEIQRFLDAVRVDVAAKIMQHPFKTDVVNEFMESWQGIFNALCSKSQIDILELKV